jgi:trehalose 6-phosphate synthase
MERAMDAAAGRINATYGDVSWTPVRYTNRPYTRTALAGLYRVARVGLVTPLRDGMNLVAKEYVAAQDPKNPGVLILSRFAGAAAEFGPAALLVNPYDPDAVAAALARAIAMPLDERLERHAKLFETLKRNDVTAWGDRFLSTLIETGDVSRPRATASTVRADSPPWGKRELLPHPTIPSTLPNPRLSGPGLTGLSPRR